MVKQGTMFQEMDVTLQHAEQFVPIFQQQMSRDMLIELERRGLQPVGVPATSVEDVFFTDDETGELSLLKRISCSCRYEEGKEW
jgi:hypothetical protein